MAGVDITKPVEITLKTKDGEVKQKFEFFIKKTVHTDPKIKYYIDEEKNLGIFTMNEYREKNGDFVNRFFTDYENSF